MVVIVLSNTRDCTVSSKKVGVASRCIVIEVFEETPYKSHITGMEHHLTASSYPFYCVTVYAEGTHFVVSLSDITMVFLPVPSANITGFPTRFLG